MNEAVAFPRLRPDQIALLAGLGTTRPGVAGEVLQREGDLPRALVIPLSGSVDVSMVAGGERVLVRRHDPASFVGELSLLMSQRCFLNVDIVDPGELLVVGIDALRSVIANQPELGDLFLAAFVERRKILMAAASPSLRIIGSRFSRESLALREYAWRTNLVHEWVDYERAVDADRMLADAQLTPTDLPAVIVGGTTHPRMTPGALSSLLGLTIESVPDRYFDLVVVGAGPAGLAASVYGASEGLSTLAVESVAIGGQAGTSSRIDNYLGFPTGVSGQDLANRAMVQAIKFGAQLTSPCLAQRLSSDSGHLVLRLSDGTEVACRAAIIATGAQYRRLDLPELDRFEGAGVYYAAPALEATQCAGGTVVVIGGGNSAGQAAMFLSETAARVILAIRGDSLAKTMSNYLIERIAAHPRIEVRTGTQVSALRGNSHLDEVCLSDRSGQEDLLACGGVFCFIGAAAGTGWLSQWASLDPAGFIRTDRNLPAADLGPRWGELGRTPLPFETAHPGIFAVGDVRAGSMKRVAAAVGEGSSAVRSVHDHLSG